MTDAHDLVVKKWRVLVACCDGNEIIADMRPVETEFLEAVNDTQQGVIRNRINKNDLTYFSRLPNAAEQFAFEFLKTHHGEEIKQKKRALDVAFWRAELAESSKFPRSSVNKRWVSGAFVILPMWEHVVCVERMYLGGSHIDDAYWGDVKAEAKRLGPLDIPELRFE